MRRAAVALLLLTLAGCGGKKEANVATSSAPCLHKLGLYIDHGLPKELNILGFALPGMPPPAGVTGVGDVSYLSPGAGARTAELYFNTDEETAVDFERTWGRGRTRVRAGLVVLIWKNAPSRQNGTVSRFGQTVVFWTTRPSPKQGRELGACLGG